MKENLTIDAAEIARFEQMAEDWWNPHGKFKPLHDLNPVRLRFIREHSVQHYALDSDATNALQSLDVLDIGCGGGLLSEPLARMGGTVTGVDASAKNIGIAKTHAEKTGTAVKYLATTAEALVEEGMQFDVVCALEVVEHVADVPLFLESCAKLVKPGGMLFMSTINRTMKAYAMAIIGAEYVLRWLPRGTHDWNKFLRPSELVLPLESHDLKVTDLQGLVLHPLQRQWHLSAKDLDVNYMLEATKPR